ncbi:hypothetical protein ABDK56_10165 [Sphingomonas sp. ASV193]|uniref:hypothetical protein n=1 Tax=Sphingomonas sp. ASV193 TaxID=3144405 RepID=UPI0032E92190
MRKLLAAIPAAALALVATPAAAHHINYLDTPFDSFSSCNVFNKQLSNDDDFLLDAFPGVFSSEGEVRSFLNKAFTCQQSGDSWYITDHRLEVLQSDWWANRNN